MKEKIAHQTSKEPVSKALLIAWIFIALVTASFVFFALYEVFVHNSALPFMYSLILLAGLIFEFKSICERWDRVLITALICFSFSFVAFLPIKQIGVDNSLRIWPFMICAVFGVASMVSYKEKSSIKLTEGVIFMQFLALVYWLIVELIKYDFNKSLFVTLGIVILCSLFVAFHAFSYSKLTDRVRFLFSFGSAVIMLFFASLNIFAVYQMQRMATGTDILLTMLQHFLLGVSSIYIIQNIYLIIVYFPSENWDELKHYKKQRKKFTTYHISRFSDKQVKRKHSAICLVVCGLIFSINYFVNVLPVNLAIWLAFLIVSLILGSIEKRLTKQIDVIAK